MTHYSEQDLRRAVAAAVRAPSMHNNQPWRFQLRDGRIDVRVDPARLLPATDPTGWAARVACGAAVFNLRLALTVEAVRPQVLLYPDPADPHVVARLVPGRPRPATPAERSLYAAIPRRHTNRFPFWPHPVPADARARMMQAARDEGGWLELVIGPAAAHLVTEIVRSAGRVLERDEKYRTELARWIRTQPAPDGVPTDAAGPAGEPYDPLPQRPYGGPDRVPGHDFEPDPVMAILGAAGNTRTDQIVAGMALQRVLLTATDAGLAVSLMSQPIEVTSAREQLRTALGRYGTPQMVMRIGYGRPGYPPPRRDVDDVIDSEDVIHVPNAPERTLQAH